MTSPRRRPARGVRRWLGVLVLAGSITTLMSPLRATAAPPEAELTLSALSPLSLQPGTTLSASGLVSVDQTVDEVVVRLEVSTTAFASRGAVTEAAGSPPVTTPVLGAEDSLGRVRPGDTDSFRIRVPADDLPFFTAGVYGLRVVAVDASTGLELASVSTFLPWAPEGVGVLPSRLLMLWPLTGGPYPTPTVPAEAEEPLEDFAPGGRLDTLVSSGGGAPATWIVDPALLTVARRQQAGRWVAALSDVVARREVVALPYGDPDLAAVASAGGPGILVRAQAKGDRVLSRGLGAEPRPDFAWPAEGEANDRILSVAQRAGDSLALLDAATVPLVSELSYTPSGRLPWEELEILLADPPVSALTASPATTPADVLLARQRFLAETLLHSLELPSEPRLLVVAPPRQWDPSALWADELVRALRRAPWLEPVSLQEAVQPEPPAVEREEPSVDEETAERQLPSDLVTSARQGLSDNRRLEAILTRPGRISLPIEDALFTSISTAWRSDVSAARAAQQATLEELASLRNRVRIVSQGGTLSSDRGSFPVTLRNQLDQPVIVRLDVESTDPLRLRVEGPDEEIRIGAQRSVSVSVDLDAVTSGRLAFDARLMTPRNVPYDDPVTVTVDVRGFGRVTLLVFGAAVVLLVTAAGLRVFRRLRARGSRP